MADSDLQIRGGGGGGGGGGAVIQTLRYEEAPVSIFFFRHPRAPPLDPPLLKSSFVHYVLEQVNEC